jgi:peptide/nickel transport system ATP-binding protein/oligopeptide transport system ATP-binding protein
VFGLVGESGSGKTTLGRMLLRLVEPTAGQVLFEGRDITTLSGVDLLDYRRKAQIIFQNPYSSLNPRRSIADSLGVGYEVFGIARGSKRRELQSALLERVGLSADVLDRYPHQFSGGQRQRLVIARALTVDPRFIVADEPVSALDVSIQAQILNLLSDLQDELGLTIVFIAHDLSVVRHMCDRVAVMYLGTIVELADNETLYRHPRHPYTGALMSAVPVADPHEGRSKQRQILGGDVPSPTNPPPACRFHTRCPKAQERCWTEPPPLTPKEGGGVAACHFPLTDEEAAARIPSVAEAETAT